MPLPHVNFQVPETGIGLVDAAPDHDPGPNWRFKLFAVDRTVPVPSVKKKVSSPSRSGDMPDEHHIAVVLVDIIAVAITQLTVVR